MHMPPGFLLNRHVVDYSLEEALLWQSVLRLDEQLKDKAARTEAAKQAAAAAAAAATAAATAAASATAAAAATKSRAPAPPKTMKRPPMLLPKHGRPGRPADPVQRQALIADPADALRAMTLAN